MIDSLVKIKRYCEQEQFKGWDPFDGLNSRLFMSLPWLRDNALYRLCVIQFFKRCPINLRRLALVPKDYNAKGVGLLLQGYCNLHNAINSNGELKERLGKPDEIDANIRLLADWLVANPSPGDYHGACWGYNFDWQNRTGFNFPKYTPTVVATTFCASALMSAWDVTGDRRYLDTALTAGDFVLNDLHRTPCNGGFLFSYSPLQGHETVFNASLLGSRLLSLCYHYTHDERYLEPARESVKACCAGQRDDGSWPYGMLQVQQWVDSFHTGYNLDALGDYERLTGDTAFHEHLQRGFDYYIANFFEADGCPKYYNNKKYPIDIHCPAQLFVTLARLGRYRENNELAGKVLNWTVKNMQSPQGYFYYQLKKGISSRISYMRWSNAFMFYALTYYLLYGKI